MPFQHLSLFLRRPSISLHVEHVLKVYIYKLTSTNASVGTEGQRVGAAHGRCATRRFEYLQETLNICGRALYTRMETKTHRCTPGPIVTMLPYAVYQRDSGDCG